MALRIRYKAPSGPGTIELPEDATVGQLFAALKEKTSSNDVTIKYGWPPKALSAEEADATLKSLNLQRESLTVVPAEPAESAAPPAAPLASSDPGPISLKSAPKGPKDQNVSVRMPSGTYLVLRVMPDDNSCLFTAVGGALRGTAAGADGVTPERLRRVVVDYIKEHPETYNELVLEKSPEVYCARMLQPDVWGGAIELGIISEVFDIEICVVNVKDGGVIKYGEGKHDLRCVLVWSNIHYDRIAEIFDEEQVGVDFDVTTWSAFESEDVIENARKLCGRLKDEFHYFTDTSDFLVKCMQCGALIQGEKAIVEHSRTTGHTAIEEIIDL